MAYPRMFEDIPRYVMKHSPECLATLPAMFGNIPQAYGDILWNVWQHFPEYNIPHILRVPRIPLLVPVFLVLYIAILGIFLNFYVVFAFDSSKARKLSQKKQNRMVLSSFLNCYKSVSTCCTKDPVLSTKKYFTRKLYCATKLCVSQKTFCGRNDGTTKRETHVD